jgi:hypothetical protein
MTLPINVTTNRQTSGNTHPLQDAQGTGALSHDGDNCDVSIDRESDAVTPNNRIYIQQIILQILKKL